MNLRPDPFLAVAYEDILDTVGIVLYQVGGTTDEGHVLLNRRVDER